MPQRSPAPPSRTRVRPQSARTSPSQRRNLHPREHSNVHTADDITPVDRDHLVPYDELEDESYSDYMVRKTGRADEEEEWEDKVDEQHDAFLRAYASHKGVRRSHYNFPNAATKVFR